MPVRAAPITCVNCGTVNVAGATACTTCGNDPTVKIRRGIPSLVWRILLGVLIVAFVVGAVVMVINSGNASKGATVESAPVAEAVANTGEPSMGTITGAKPFQNISIPLACGETAEITVPAIPANADYIDVNVGEGECLTVVRFTRKTSP